MKINRIQITEDEETTAVKKLMDAANEEESSVEFIHSTSTLLNLAASGKGKDGGWARGRIVNLVGDGSSGKTLLALELAAYAYHKMNGNESRNFPKVKKVRIIYDNAEGVMDFNIKKMYGRDFENHVEWITSSTVQGWGRNITRAVQDNKPGEMLLYVIDSLDALTSEEGLERFEEAAKKDKAESGTFGTEKAAYLSKSFFSNMCSLMKGKDVTILIISQIRMKIGITFGEKYGRAGGKALDFYTHQVCWLSEIEKLKGTFRGKEVVYGIRVLARFKRNKVAKPFRDAEIIILFDHGTDDIGSNISYLYGPKVKLIEFEGEEYKKEDFIKHIIANGLQDKLSDMVERDCKEIEDHFIPNRPSKY